MTTSRTFLNDWVCTWGPPKRILTDRGTNFTSSYFKEFSKWLGARPINTVAYRPQANGQNERTHRELHNYLSIYLNQIKSRTHWDTLLRFAAWVHNTTVHEALKASPYEILTGIKPSVAGTWLPEKADNITEESLHEFFGI
jgi:Integrase core domain.